MQLFEIIQNKPYSSSYEKSILSDLFPTGSDICFFAVGMAESFATRE